MFFGLHCIGTFVENPKQSRLWDFEPVATLARCDGVFRVDFDMCEYGSAYRKSTAVLTNIRALLSLSRSCSHGRKHAQLRGTARVYDHWKQRHVWKNLTEAAGEYTDELVLEWSRLLKEVCPASGRGRGFPDRDGFQQELAHAAAQLRPGAREARLHSRLRQRDRDRAVPGGRRFAGWPGSLNLELNGQQYMALHPGIVFGQHSNAEAAARRRREERLSRLRASRACRWCCRA